MPAICPDGLIPLQSGALQGGGISEGPRLATGAVEHAVQARPHQILACFGAIQLELAGKRRVGLRLLLVLRYIRSTERWPLAAKYWTRSEKLIYSIWLNCKNSTKLIVFIAAFFFKTSRVFR